MSMKHELRQLDRFSVELKVWDEDEDEIYHGLCDVSQWPQDMINQMIDDMNSDPTEVFWEFLDKDGSNFHGMLH